MQEGEAELLPVQEGKSRRPHFLIKEGERKETENKLMTSCAGLLDGVLGRVHMKATGKAEASV